METAVRRTNLYFDSYFVSLKLIDNSPFETYISQTFGTLYCFLFIYQSSIVANDLEPTKKKQALNELFRGKFPHIQLTFSKFKSIKRDMLKACTEQVGTRLSFLGECLNDSSGCSDNLSDHHFT